MLDNGVFSVRLKMPPCNKLSYNARFYHACKIDVKVRINTISTKSKKTIASFYQW